MSKKTTITNPFTGEKIPRNSPSANLLRRKGWDQSSYVKESLNSTPESMMTLRSHQLKVVNHMKDHRGLIVFHSVGSGKTLTAAIVTRDYLKRNPGGRVFIITPVSLEENFRKELIASTKDIDLERYTFLSYTKIHKLISKGEINCNNCCIIIDEAHNLRGDIGGEANHVIAKSIIEFSKTADRVLLLTATPFVNKPYDIANLISIVRNKDPPTERYFDHIMGDEFLFKHFFGGYISIYDELENREQYPDFSIDQIYIPMTHSYEEAYEEIERSTGTIYNFKNPTTFYHGLRRASNDIDSRFGSPKVNWVTKFITDKWKGEKTVIFSNWIESGIEIVKNVLDSKGIPYSSITGSMKAKSRDISVKDYNSGEKPILLISRAGGEGLDLKGTRYLIMLDPGWNSAQSDQVMGRTIRYRSHEDLDPKDRFVKVYRLFLVKNLEFKRIMDWSYNLYYDYLDNRYRDSGNGDRDSSTAIWSVDLFLRALAIDKQKGMNEFKKRLLPISV